MNHLKLIFTLLIVAALATGSAFAQDTIKKADAKTYSAIEQAPEFPGGVPAFNKFITKNLKYPDVAKVLRLTGKVYVSFTIDRDGLVTDVKPVKCLGAGCESEAVRVIAMSPKWTPGLQNGKRVRVMYTVPINFYYSDTGETIPTPMRRLRNSDYVFLFYIKGKAYTVDEAEKMLGKEFDPGTIVSVENYDHPEYSIPDKKGVYLIVMKNS